MASHLCVAAFNHAKSTPCLSSPLALMYPDTSRNPSWNPRVL
uniref:Uncharacterized protein n=1 Tax=Populus trichocarpa TaxID=3694 RepID=A0A3N7G2H5_POPTR